jgi:hypothetical protein
MGLARLLDVDDESGSKVRSGYYIGANRNNRVSCQLQRRSILWKPVVRSADGVSGRR